MIYQADHISFAYPNSSRDVLREVSLSVSPGEVVALLGPNGAGKTTLLHCMMNLLKPREGRILLQGVDVSGMKPKDIAGMAAFVPQSHEPSFDYTVLEFVTMGRAPKISIFGSPDQNDRMFCMEILVRLGIDSLADHSYLEISGGERQQALIARALAQEPKVLIFDEPTAHLDFSNQQRVLGLVREMADSGLGVLMTSHHPDHAFMVADRTALLTRAGALEQGPTEETATEEHLRNVYGADLRLIHVPELGRKVCLLTGIQRGERQ